MEWYIASIAFLLLLIILILFRLKTNSRQAEPEYNSLRELSYSLRAPRPYGEGINVNPLSRNISDAYRFINSYRTRNEEIYAFEKWLYDNHYLIKRYLKNSVYKAFKTLPHVFGVPRIVMLARYIVKSYGKLDEENIKKAVDGFSAVTPLTFGELQHFKSALCFALVTEIAKLSEKCIHYRNMQRKALHPKLKREYASTDSYINAYIAKWGSISEKYTLKYGEIDFSTCRIGFMNSLIDNELNVKRCIEALRNADAYIGIEEIIEMSVLNTIFAKDSHYKDMSAVAKFSYLNSVSLLAKKINVAERTVANSAIYLSIYFKKDLGEFLFKVSYLKRYVKTGKLPKKCIFERGGQRLYSTVVLLVSAALALVPLLFEISYITIMTVPLVFIFALSPVEFILKRILDTKHIKRPVMSMGYTAPPEEGKTIVVVSQFVDSVHTFETALSKLKETSFNCVSSNVEYALLMDFPAGNIEWTEKDDEILSEIQKSAACKENCRISLFVRKRIKSGDKFISEERKRGAILCLFKALQSGNYSEFSYYSKTLSGFKFAVLLDDDSTLMPGSILNAVNSMLHPYNQKYDLMSFGSKINRYSLTTKYSKRFEDECGIDCYPSYSDFYGDRFDSALYCGKAIVRIERYLSKLADAFPNGRILSHDIIEGAYLRSATLKQCIYEDAPASFYGDSARNSRWARGDVMLLPYIGSIVYNRRNERTVNPINPIYKLVIFINAMNVIRDFALLLTFFLAVLANLPYLFLYALAFLTVPYLYMLVSVVRRLVKGIRPIYVVQSIIGTIAKMVSKIMLLPYYAFNGIVIYVNTTIKMLFNSDKLLEWKPFFLTQRGNTYFRYVRLFTASKTFITALAILSMNQIFLYYAALYFIYALIIYNNKTLRLKHTDERADREELKGWAERTYKYFDDTVSRSPNALIPDNLQINPPVSPSRMTSPTNIGFSMLAYVSARELEFIEPLYAKQMISSILNTVEKLPKWNGHLFNWYDIEKLSVMEPLVVSTVDSGNFCAALVVVKQFSEHYGWQEIYEKCNIMLSQCDFSKLYDTKRKLLHIVYNKSKGQYSGYYDVLASEARLAYYIAISKGLECTPYFVLSRECMSKGGNTLLSWSGTAFEYLMPRLFMIAPHNSLISTTEKNVSKIQAKYKLGKCFGISESGYYDFNEEMRYAYSANGIEGLALSSEVGKKVVSPYSSALTLPYIREKSIANLRMLTQEMFGEYGFFEAYDYDKNKVVASYMSHHQGMLLSALTNYLAKNKLAEYFMSDPRTASAKMLLAEERIKLAMRRADSTGRRVIENASEEGDYISENRLPPKVNVLTNGDYSVVTDALGRGYSIIGDRLINKFNANLYEECGQFSFVNEEGFTDSFTPTFYPYRSEDYHNAVFTSTQSEFINITRGISESVKALPFGNGEIRKLTVKNKSGKKKCFKIGHYLDLALNTEDAVNSHAVFSDMFIKTEIRDGFVLAYRKQLNGEINEYLTVTVCGLDNVVFNTNKSNVIGRLGKLSKTNIFNTVNVKAAPVDGDVLYPCIALTGEKILEDGESAEIYFMINVYANYEAACNGYSKCCECYENGIFELVETVGALSAYVKNLQVTCGGKILRELASNLLYRGSNQKSLSYIYDNNAEIVAENKKIDIKRKNVLFRYRSEHDNQSLAATLAASKIINIAGIKHKLIVLSPKAMPAEVEHYLREQILRYKTDAGLVSDENEKIKLENCCYCEADVFTDAPFFELKVTGSDYLPIPSRPLLLTGEGGFTESNGYYVLPKNGVTALPYSNVIGLSEGGTVITENGGGFTFGKNSRENKFTAWREPLSDIPSEVLYFTTAKGTARVNCGAVGARCCHHKGLTEFGALFDGCSIKTEVYTVFSGSNKVYEVTVTNNTESKKNCKLTLALDLVLGWKKEAHLLVNCRHKGKMQIVNIFNKMRCTVYIFDHGEYFTSRKELFGLINGIKQESEDYADYYGAAQSIELNPKDIRTLFFVFGSETAEMVTRDSVLKDKATSIKYFEDLSNIKIDTGIWALDLLFNEQLLYQVMSCRVNARASLYQCGGAYGFRDQLQDMLCLIYNHPEKVREHILLSASHQYSEGDVQHWWHPPRLGVRTRITDDRLFLAFVANEYIKITGDRGILSEKVNYLSSKPLEKHEVSRYELPHVKRGAEQLVEHIKLAITSVLNFGRHNLLLIGGGDWNDGLDKVGHEGKGESVWLSMFAYMVIKDSLDYFIGGDRLKMIKALERLSEGINNAFYGDRFIAHYTDGGELLGVSDSAVSALSLLPQAFAEISGAAEKNLCTVALTTARQLVDYTNGVIKLLDPPFDPAHYHGYISMYPEGIRENGGQYTHGAVWYIKALFMAGQADYAYELLTLINPIEKCRDPEFTAQYMGEPYVLAADVYSHKQYKGRAGWTWYTGSASWLYKIILEDMLGLKVTNGCIIFKPNLPSAINSVKIRYDYKNSIYNIEIKKCETKGLFIEGVKCGENLMPLNSNKGKVNVLFYY